MDDTAHGITLYQLITIMSDYADSKIECVENVEGVKEPTMMQYIFQLTLLLHMALALERQFGQFKFAETTMLYRCLVDEIWSGLNERLDDTLDEDLIKHFSPDTENLVENPIDWGPHRTAADFTSSELQSLVRRLDIPDEGKEVLVKSIGSLPNLTKLEEYLVYAVKCLYETIEDLETSGPEENPLFLRSLRKNHSSLTNFGKIFKSIEILYRPYQERARAALNNLG